MFLRQSTASQSVAIGPFVDETDFKTAETALTINNTDIKLVVNGGASANKNSGGGTHRVNGVYGITLDATDTATVGEMEISVVVSGALPVFHKYRVLEEAVYDALFAASAPGYVANASVNVAQISGDATAADNAESFFDGTGYAGTNNVMPTTTTVTNGVTVTTNNDKTGYALSAGGVQAVWDALSAALSTAGSIGKRIVDYLTGDSYTRLGAPAGSSIADDISNVSGGTLSIRPVKNAVFSNFMFPMYDATTKAPLAGLTVTAQRAIDGGGFASCANAVSSVGSGVYKIDLAAADLNGDKVMFKFTATGADVQLVELFTQG